MLTYPDPAGLTVSTAQPLVSVIVRSMDRPSLRASLDSVLQQHWRPIEVVLVNALGQAHGRIEAQQGDLQVRVMQHPQQLGLQRAQAAQAGLDGASGEFALFLDDDDLLMPEHLNRLVEALQASQAPAAFADTDWGQFEQGQWHSRHHFNAPFDRVRLLFENYLPIHAVLFKRQLAQRHARFDSTLQVLEDWDFWLQLAMQGDFIHVPGLTARYLASGQDQTQVQSDTPSALAAREQLLRKWQSRLSPDLFVASMQRLQSSTRQASQALAKNQSQRTTELGLRDILLSRELEISDHQEQQQNLMKLVQSREIELGNATTQVQSLQNLVAHREHDLLAASQEINAQQDLVAHRERDLLAASQEIESLRKLVAARDGELSNLAICLQATQDLVSAREGEINNWRHANTELQIQLTATQAKHVASEQLLAAANTEHHKQAQALALLQAEAPPQALKRAFKGSPMFPADDQPSATPPPDGADTIVFTIVSRNYFHFALTLMASVAEHMPGTHRVVALCDEMQDLPVPDSTLEVIGAQELGIQHFDRMAMQYSILELNTAIKPFVFQRLRQRPNVHKIIYFDPDIQLYSSGAPLLQRLESAQAVLTPHLTAPLLDDRHPSDLAILQSGTYNLGFLALRCDADTDRLVQWWQQKLLRDCVVDIPRGLFTDQKWMDLVPGFLPRALIERHLGWNVAYWNLLHRDLSEENGQIMVNGQPLFFFHFSGHDPHSGWVSKHQDRFRMSDCSATAKKLFAQYSQTLTDHGRERYASLPYAFARLADGTPLPDCARRAIRNHLDWSQPIPDLLSLEGARYLINFLTAAVDTRQPAISRLALQLYQDRADLQAAFPDMLVMRREAYLAWFAQQAGPEAGVVGVLAGLPARPKQPVSTPVSPRPQAPAAAPAAAAGAAQVVAITADAAEPAVVLPYRLAYRLAWKARHLLRPLTSLEFRQRMRLGLLHRAFPPQRPAARPAIPSATANATEATPATATARKHLDAGLTLIGYLHAESGVGESARATLRALASTDLPHSAQDFRVGNVARMAETVDGRLLNGTQYAISLFHINADQLPVARTFIGEAPFTHTYRIGFWAWELENFPREWDAAFGHVDEVWVPSSFCQRAIAARSPVPVLVMPHAIDILSELQPDRPRFKLRQDSVVFLAMADMMSLAGRKNPFAAIAAFASAFPGADHNAQLVVKIAHPDRDPAALKKLQALAAQCPGIVLLTRPMDRSELNTLLDSVDCFVSLHRSEGFGLVIAESMARGKVVIATGWSGNMDFMNALNALPVDFDLITLPADEGPYRQGERWAEPRHDDAVAKMRLVASDPALRQRLGQKAKADCERWLSPQGVGAAMAARARSILSALGAG